MAMIDDSRKRGVRVDLGAILAGKNERTDYYRSIDDVIPAITHELLSPLTSVRALSEILRDNPDMDAHRRQEFLGIIVEETERLTNAVNHIDVLGA